MTDRQLLERIVLNPRMMPGKPVQCCAFQGIGGRITGTAAGA
jgi:hypothetical protein